MGGHLEAYTYTWPLPANLCCALVVPPGPRCIILLPLGDKNILVKICFGMENITFFFSFFFILCSLFQILDIYMPINLAGSVYFAQPDALKVQGICIYSSFHSQK